MDRNFDNFLVIDRSKCVALLAEGVDRNSIACDRQSGGQKVALLAEGVDRNICYINGVDYLAGVALLAEGVDRNSNPSSSTTMQRPSPSSRRAWIEIRMLGRMNNAN